MLHRNIDDVTLSQGGEYRKCLFDGKPTSLEDSVLASMQGVGAIDYGDIDMNIVNMGVTNNEITVHGAQVDMGATLLALEGINDTLNTALWDERVKSAWGI